MQLADVDQLNEHKLRFIVTFDLSYLTDTPP